MSSLLPAAAPPPSSDAPVFGPKWTLTGFHAFAETFEDDGDGPCLDSVPSVVAAAGASCRFLRLLLPFPMVAKCRDGSKEACLPIEDDDLFFCWSNNGLNKETIGG